ncbi:MAG: ArsR family transcriptional regulator [Thermoplasmata archaeon]
MKKFTEEMLSLFSSPTRCTIIELMSKGYDHPEDLAKKLEMTRQGVDKHLLELHDWGLVERNAIFPPDGRPKIIYELTKECRQLRNALDNIGDKYRETMISRAENELEHLDTKLAEGDLAEEIYEKKVREVKNRWNYDRLRIEKD